MIADGHAVVLKVRAKRHRDLSRAGNQVACRLHAVLCELVPGGVPGEITAGRAEKILAQIRPAGAVGKARCELAAEPLAGMGHLDGQRREVKKKLAAAVKATGTTVTSVFGVGPVIAPRSSAMSSPWPGSSPGPLDNDDSKEDSIWPAVSACSDVMHAAPSRAI